MIRFFGYIFAIGAAVLIIGLGVAAAYVGAVSKDLPDYEVLENYQPPVMTRMHAANGKLMAEFAIKRRLYLPIQAVPDMIKAAYISAEDKNFYEHFGLDPEGFLRAIVNNVKNIGSGRRPEGASTITQQVAKNFLLTANATLQRKVQEAILAMRIEKAYSKDHILELYLNEIYLGRGAYGIAAAALTYFNKSVNELTVEQIAYLAALPKGPANYDPFKHTDRALARRNWVLDRMAENNYISQEDAEIARKKPLGVTLRGNDNYVFAADYFTEEVRRQIVARYGSDTLYQGGLSVRTTLNPQLQYMARQALHDGLVKFDHIYGWRGAFDHIDIMGDWGVPLAAIEAYADLPEWQLAVVLETAKDRVKIGLQPQKELSGALSSQRKTAFISAADMKWAYRLVDARGYRSTARDPTGVLKPGDVVFVQAIKGKFNAYNLQQFPKIQGAMVVMEPKTGRVLAMIGGFSFAKSEFNRATQAYRQPGSAFKPFVYSAALDNGYTPSSVVLDGPVEIDQGPAGIWRPKNYGGTFAGPSTLRYGIEHSRNLMTVRLANDVGMPIVAEYAERFGIYEHLQPVLAMALGAGETTVLRLVSAYAVIANGGRSLDPSLVDRIQDRYGKTIYRHDRRICEQCNVTSWQNQPEPVLIDERDQVLDPMTAYQITSMMEGVIQRGTARRLQYLKRDIAGKTGTTNDSKDAWFVGFTPDIVIGVYMGYDSPKSLGAAGTGSSLAAPVFGEFMSHAMVGKPDVPFKMPEGMIQIAIDRKTGMRASAGNANAFVEAFKPGTGPADVYQVIGATESFREGVKVPLKSPQVNQAIQSGAGGLY
ncbi:penicillin-binding protein 1A [Candidatus Tokpelaia sp.]|uniref:penicillin-binding protein 1A n=1 Tax=Candidatus Tokpelaia sp. TaxID=2233777 RepID=UPI00123AF990|nr:penicillin-binding protein 1A [Candidatus Tokpelaia sp.]KAA6405002.1 penicillin-binding protein [Candidatus Tokpelaia sp.]